MADQEMVQKVHDLFFKHERCLVPCLENTGSAFWRRIRDNSMPNHEVAGAVAFDLNPEGYESQCWLAATWMLVFRAMGWLPTPPESAKVAEPAAAATTS